MYKLPVIPPKSAWNRPLKLNLEGFFSALGKFAIDYGVGQSGEASKDIIDAIASFGLAREPHELAGLLISRSLMWAVEEVIAPYRREYPAVVWPGPVDFATALDAELEKLTLQIDDRFFDHPQDIEIVGQFRELVEAWLSHLDLKGQSPKEVAAPLSANFVYGLHRDCILHRGEYARLFSSLNSEFSSAWQRERSWAEYRHWLESELAVPVFGQAFSLREIFQWPRAYHERKKRYMHGEAESSIEERHVVDLRRELDEWLTGDPEGVSKRTWQSMIRIISGGPGAGKSSFIRMYTAHRISRGDRALLVPVHNLNFGYDLLESINSLCRNLAHYPDSPLENGEKALLLVLDGIDELSKDGLSGPGLASSLMLQVRKALDTRNSGRAVRLRVILGGRPITVQDSVSADSFRTEREVLHLIPYAVKTDTGGKFQWLDSQHLLSVDQRDAWWRRYGELTSGNYGGLPQALASESLFETSTQPLLGFLLALAHGDAIQRGEARLPDASRNEIYRDLIHAVFDRDYATPANRHMTSASLTRKQFDAVLEQMALAAWHENARIVRVSAVERLCEKAGLAGVLRCYMDTSRGHVSQLFTAFYFCRNGTQSYGEESFEFTHKSFAEYLVARRFISKLEEDARRVKGRLKDKSVLLTEWLEVFGPSGITADLLGYLLSEIELRSREDVAMWQDGILRLIDRFLTMGMPCERIEGLRFVEMSRWSANAENALLAMLKCCTSVTGRANRIAWPCATSAADWFRRLQISSRETILPLDGLVMEGHRLDGIDLRAASLRCVNLKSSDLRDANLGNANLEGANLEGANLEGANLEGANLEGANLRNANLNDVNLERANILAAIITLDQLASTRGAPIALEVE